MYTLKKPKIGQNFTFMIISFLLDFFILGQLVSSFFKLMWLLSLDLLFNTWHAHAMLTLILKRL